MPTYHIEMMEGRTVEQKRKLAEEITRVSVEVLGGTPEMVDILITDVNMPQLSGIDLAGIVKEKYPDAEILFVSGYDDFEYARQALALSAVWYLLKPVQDDELLTALLRRCSCTLSAGFLLFLSMVA